jgi:hypothetical protein
MSSSIALTVRSGIGTATATILSRLRDKELIPWPFTSNSALMTLQEKAFAAKKSGQVAGLNQATFAVNTIFIEEAGADVQDGDS